MKITVFLLAISSSAQAYDGPDQARVLLMNAGYCKFAVSARLLTTDAAELATLDADRAKATTDLEETAPAAIRSAAGSPELEKAIKAFYASADAYCKSPTDAGKVDFTTKRTALEQLLTAAGR